LTFKKVSEALSSKGLKKNERLAEPTYRLAEPTYRPAEPTYRLAEPT